MKTKLQKIMMVTALFAVTLMQAQTVIDTNYEDTWVKDGSAGASSSPWGNSLNIGAHAPDNNICAVFPFLLPAIPAGQEVTAVTFDSELTLIHGGIVVGNALDLYGLGARVSAVVAVTDFYYGGYDGDASDATALQQNYIEQTSSLGRVSTTTTGDIALKSFIMDQYTNNDGENKYIFLRLSPNQAFSAYQRMFVFGHEGAAVDLTRTAKLTITFDAVAGVDDINKQSLGLYPNPVTDGRLQVSMQGFTDQADLKIYSLLGKVVHSETLEARGNNTQDVNLNLAQGIYIVKLQDETVAKTQKLIVK